MTFKELSGFELLERIELRGEDAHSWIAVIGAPDLQALNTFSMELESQSEENNKGRVIFIEGMLLSDIRDAVQSPSSDAVVLFGFEGRSKEFWTSLDINRSALERPGALFFWLSPSAFSELCRYSPNIKSYIGTTIFPYSGVKGALTHEARQQRLRELGEKFKMKDAEVIEKAEKKELEQEPEFVEWLLLLGRSDLV